jgi:hypothetical protein
VDGVIKTCDQFGRAVTNYTESGAAQILCDIFEDKFKENFDEQSQSGFNIDIKTLVVKTKATELHLSTGAELPFDVKTAIGVFRVSKHCEL